MTGIIIVFSAIAFFLGLFIGTTIALRDWFLMQIFNKRKSSSETKYVQPIVEQHQVKRPWSTIALTQPHPPPSSSSSSQPMVATTTNSVRNVRAVDLVDSSYQPARKPRPPATEHAKQPPKRETRPSPSQPMKKKSVNIVKPITPQEIRRQTEEDMDPNDERPLTTLDFLDKSQQVVIDEED